MLSSCGKGSNEWEVAALEIRDKLIRYLDVLRNGHYT